VSYVDGGWRGMGRSNTWTVRALVGARAVMTTEAACDACGGNNDGGPGHELGLSEGRVAWHGSARVSKRRNHGTSGDDLAGVPSRHRQDCGNNEHREQDASTPHVVRLQICHRRVEMTHP